MATTGLDLRLPERLHNRILGKKQRLHSKGLPPDILKEIEATMQVEFVYNSNSIEGVTLSLGETAIALRGMTVHGKPIDDVLAAQNHKKALRLIKQIAFSNRRISEHDILEIHKATMSALMSNAGEYRKIDVRIAGASFTPPPSYEVSEQMKELVRIINTNPDELRPVELAAYAHFTLAWIHPFDNGNGRLARLLMNLILVRNGYPFAVVKKVDRTKYIGALDKVSKDGDFQPFLTYIARCVEQTLDIYLLQKKKEKLLPLSVLAKGTPYSAEYLSLLARKGTLDAVKVGRVWKSTKSTIKTYIENHKSFNP
jgi:Fic family protein